MLMKNNEGFEPRGKFVGRKLGDVLVHSSGQLLGHASAGQRLQTTDRAHHKPYLLGILSGGENPTCDVEHRQVLVP